MKYLAALLVCLCISWPVEAQTPEEVARWVFDQTIIEYPETFTMIYYEEEEWSNFALTVIGNIRAEAATNGDNFPNLQLIIHAGPKALTDFHLLHEALHYLLSQLHSNSDIQAIHSEEIIHAMVSKILCKNSGYREWKSEFEEGWLLMPFNYMCDQGYVVMRYED